MSRKNFLIAIVMGIALAAGIFFSVRLQQDARALTTATVLPQPVDLPEFSLLDQDGAPVGRGVFADNWNLVFFGFTNCPDVCPLTLQLLSTARQRLAEQGREPLPRIVLVSVDPERDTPERLAAYVNSFGDGNLALTGSLDEIRKLTDALGIYFNKGSGDDEYYSVDHSSVVIVIGPDGRYRALFSSPHEIDNFVHDLPILMSR